MRFQVLLKDHDLKLLAGLVGDKFQFLSGVDIHQLDCLDWIEISTSKRFLQVNSDYSTPAIGVEGFWGFEVALFEVKSESVAEAASRLKQGWVYLDGRDQIIQDVVVVRVTHKEANYDLVVDQAIGIVLEKRVIGLQFSNPEILVFEVAYFDELQDFEDACKRITPEDETWELSLELKGAAQLLEEMNV